MWAALIPVGPGGREARRLKDLTEKLAHHEAPDVTVLVDDDPQPRQLDASGLQVGVIKTTARQTRRRLDRRSAMVAGTLEGLARCRELGAEMVVKLDTDAAVIAPFSRKLNSAFDADLSLGVVGSYDLTCSGTQRDWSGWERALLAQLRPGRRTPIKGYRYRRKVIRVARSTGALGGHCLGAAYAVSPSFLKRCDLRWQPWLATGISEDAIVGTLSLASGLHMRSLVARGDPFALSWKGLPDDPETLHSRGYSIVHSVKADTHEQERVLRAALAG